MGWVRLWHDMPTDPKWRTIARKSGQRVGDVIAIFNFLMVNAGENTAERGALDGLDVEDVATALDLSEADVSAVLSAMEGKVIEANRLTGWDKRQPKREDGNAQERKAAWRERKRTQENAVEHIVPQCHAPDSDADSDAEGSVANATGEKPIESDAAFWAAAKAFLQPEVSGDPGRLIGRWIKNTSKQDTISAIARAQVERPVSKIPFIEGCLRKYRKAEESEYGPC